MRYALSTRSLEEMRRFVQAGALLAFDFDGTLAPIVADPERVQMRRRTRSLLKRLAESSTCMVLTGRSREDAEPRLAGTGIRQLVGNHGAEPWAGAGRVRQEVAGWGLVLTSELPPLEGLWIENKGMSLTIHYRQCRQKRQARASIETAAPLLKNVRLVEGKECVSLVSVRAPHKGTALKAEMARLRFDRALYLGDDETDEDAFALARGGAPVYAIRVGRKNRSHADYYLRDQAEVDELLTQLLEAAASGVERHRARVE
ncbi:MAG: trehalose-phosphatase [Acidobacteria bacterium]|nr:trehalose-phosphatase [Acidobacteriota bacterium]